MIFAASFARTGVGQATDSLSAARRVVAATTLAAKEYANGVPAAGGRVERAEEVDEARQFVEMARFDIPLLPVPVRAAGDSALHAMRELFDRAAAPAEVQRIVDALEQRIAGAVGGAIVPLPARPPSLARGAQVFREQCVQCHGDGGHGDGPKAAKLTGPHPADLTDPVAMGSVTMVDIYRKVMLGVAGTAMPSFEETVPDSDRWAAAAYVATLPYGGSRTAMVFTAVRRKVDSAVVHRSAQDAVDAYLAFEEVETAVRAHDDALASRLEDDFATLRGRATARAGPDELATIQQRLLTELERAERQVADRESGANLFVQSLGLTLREGFEAILIIGALMAFLTKAGAPERRRDVAWGAWAAVAASLLTAVLVQLLFAVTSNQREALEGWTMLLATLVLFYVSYWLLSKIEADKWTAFVRGKMRDAVTSGSRAALVSVAFLAVYREGFETILFFKALLTSGGTGEAAAVLAGLALGAVGLVIIYLAINSFGLRIPLRPFFGVTGALLYYMAFVFAGKGVAELQNAGVIGMTPVESGPRVPFLGIYPTVQSLALQGVFVVLFVVAFVWMRVDAARRETVS
ncbi:MAG TPA: FTR1 family protein [Gemmatimonadales bacterium]|nr:FTR1 family protein [Gemmatimonadales bacterium]